VTELPELARGKGNKIMNIPSARAVTRDEFVIAVNVIHPGQQLTLYSGKRTITLKASDLEHYKGERGRRGNKLPRGFQKVDKAEVTEK
jgi:topoisomerase-4 subunit A